MNTQTAYFLYAGNDDYKRLAVLNRLYNPGTISFLKSAGLQAGMTVLEIGCGTGHMAVELAKCVGPKGKVIASDLNEAQLVIAKNTAKEANIENIEFLQLDLNNDLEKLHPQFDFIFGRWVIEFTKNPIETFKKLFHLLKPDGVLTYESTDIHETGCFGYPENTVPNQYQELGIKVWHANQMQLNFIKQAYCLLKVLNATNIQMAANQAIMQTPEEKLPFRLGLEASKTSILKNNILSEDKFHEMLAEFKTFETSDNIAGFYRNLLISGKHKRSYNEKST